MSTSSPTSPRGSFEIKSASLSLSALLLKTRDVAAVAAELQARLADTPDYFAGEGMVIDAMALADADEPTPLDLDALLALMRSHGMLPVALRGGSADLRGAAAARGMVDASDAVQLRDAAATAAAPAEPPARPPREAVPATLVIDRPLRSGQQVYARGGDLVLLAAVNHGAEVIADGNVHVYAPLRGKAMAGARGNTAARIFTTCLEPELLSIAGIYRTSEKAWPADVAGRAAQVRLDGEKLVLRPLETPA